MNEGVLFFGAGRADISMVELGFRKIESIQVLTPWFQEQK